MCVFVIKSHTNPAKMILQVNRIQLFVAPKKHIRSANQKYNTYLNKKTFNFSVYTAVYLYLL